MSLVTVLRSPSSENTSICTDSEFEVEDGYEEDGSSRSRTSSFEGFFASKGAAFALPDGDFARKASKHGGEMQMHLQSMVNILRDDDVLRLVVKLECKCPTRVRYLTIVSSFNFDDIEESIVMGIDSVNDSLTVGLVLPLLRDTSIELDGDGGFKLSTNSRQHIFKAVSVQTMWTAFQWVHKCSENARKHNHFLSGNSHSWARYYESRVSSDQSCINEWFEMEEILSKREERIHSTPKEQELIIKLIQHKLKEVMMKVDLEEVTSRQVRSLVEEETQMDLKEYKQFIDKEMLTILGQMDSASQIYDHVYLGSEWNACNLEELKENGVGFVLNITMEIDNFFAGTFQYLNIRLWDSEDSDLLPYWDDTNKFINQARECDSKVLVHCKMGMSRSASTVIAYGMKEYGTSLNETVKYVKARRSCIQPNQSFWKQLITYEGILNSSKQRHNKLFSSNRRRTNSDKTEMMRGAKRRRSHSRGRNKYNTVAVSSKLDPGVIVEDSKFNTIGRIIFHDDIKEFSDGREKYYADSELADDEDEEEPPRLRRYLMESTSEEVLRTWEEEMFGSASSTPIRSSTPDPDYDGREVEDVVGVMTVSDKNGKATLHRAHSVPSLVSITSKQRTSEKIAASSSELQRCQSLRVLLSGRVAALKEDFKANTLGRPSRATDLELCGEVATQAQESIEEVARNEETKIGEENKGEDVPSASSKDEKQLFVIIERSAASNTEEPHLEAEKEDIGSEADQQQIPDAHGLNAVKSGTVKRQSRNFEEGKVNLPWDWEEMLQSMENDAMELPTPESQHTDVEDSHTSGEEPTPGVVKMHAHALEQKYFQTLERDSKGVASDSADDCAESDSSFASNKVIVLETVSTTERTDVSMPETEPGQQEKSGVFDTNVVRQRVNEDMKKEKLRRRLSANQKSQDIWVESECKNDIAIQDVNVTSRREVTDFEEGSIGEEPLPGIVRRHAQDFEEMYRLKVEKGPRSPGTDTESDIGAKSKQISSGQQDEEPPSDSVFAPKKVIILKETFSDRKGAKTAETTASDKDQSIEDYFDVDLLLRRVNEDMKKEKIQRRFGADIGDEELMGLPGVGDVPKMETYKPDSVVEHVENIQEGDSEIPRPGIVKRNTEILMERARNVQEQERMKRKCVLKDDQDEESNTHDPITEVLGIIPDDSPTRNIHVTDLRSTREEGNSEAQISEEKTEDTDLQVGLVKRHTLLIEGRSPVPQKVEPEMAKFHQSHSETIESIEIQDQESVPSPESNRPSALYGGEQVLTEMPLDGLKVELIPWEGRITHTTESDNHSGTVKRNTLLFEEKILSKDVHALQSESKADSHPSEASKDTTEPCKSPIKKQEMALDNKTVGDAGAKSEEEKTLDDVVDRSSVVNVRFHLKLLEEVIKGANYREQNKQRTTKALAELEEKRSLIEKERKKKESDEKEMKVQRERKYELMEKSHTDSEDALRRKEVFPVPQGSTEKEVQIRTPDHDTMLDNLSHSAVSLAIENAQKNLDSEESSNACAGNVKRRTLILEKRIRDKGVPVRRHVSLPRSIRPVERPVLARKRSLSDLTTGTATGGSDDPLRQLDFKLESPSTSLELRQRDKEGNSQCDKTYEEDDVPDNDRDSENCSDDSSEKLDKRDSDMNTKLTELIELGDDEVKLPSVKEKIQLLDRDNKDISNIS